MPPWPSPVRLQALCAVIRHGGVHRAAAQLGLAPSTVSTAVQALARELGTPLLARRGRRLEPTAAGRAVAAAAEQALADLARVREAAVEAGPAVLPVGAAEGVPQAVVAAVVAPAWRLERPPRLRVHIDSCERLFEDLAGGGLAAALVDRLPPPELDAHARVHPLPPAPVVLLAAPVLARRCRRLPQDLDGAPLILPEPGDPLRRRWDQWCEARGLAPRIAVESDDPQVRRHAALAGAGILPAPAAAGGDGLAVLGRLAGIDERWWLLARRGSRDPALAAIVAALRAR